MSRRVVLASTSRYRAQLLERIGLDFESCAPKYDEHNDPALHPHELVRLQAEGKARSLRGDRPDAVIIGSDQVAHLDGDILTKPGSHEQAVAQLARLAGREHELATAVVVLDARSGDERWHLDRSRIAIRSLSAEEIDRYLRHDRPYDCAGSYKAESAGPAIFDHQRGDDPTAVIGLPLIAVCRMLRELGVDPLGCA